MSLVWAFAVPEAAAQLPPLASASAQYMPSVELQPPGPHSTQVSSYEVELNVPIPLAKSTFLVVGLAYHVDSVSYDQGFESLRAFHSLELSTMLVQLLPKNWSLTLRLAPGLGGDFADFDGDMFRFSSALLANHAFSDEFMFGFGGVTSYSFGSFLVLPALYVEWKPVAGLTLEMFIPAFANIRYLVGDRVEVGAAVEVKGNDYAIREPAIRESWPCVGAGTDDPMTPQDESRAEVSECLDHLAYSVVTVGLQTNVRLAETVWLTTFAGYAVYRRSEMMNPRGGVVSSGAQDIPGTLVVRAGIQWRIPTGDE